MPRQPTGEIRRYTRRDGTTTYTLRFRARGERWNIRLGTDEEGWTERRAQKELFKQLALVQAGVWEPPVPNAPSKEEEAFHLVATRWLREKELALKDTSVADLRWRLECHLLPHFASWLPSAIDEQAIHKYKVEKLRESRDLARAIAAGQKLATSATSRSSRSATSRSTRPSERSARYSTSQTDGAASVDLTRCGRVA